MKKALRIDAYSDWILQEMKIGKVGTVGQLWRSLHDRSPELKYEDFQRKVEDLKTAGLIDLNHASLGEFREYLSSWEYGFRLWSCTAGTLVAFLIVTFLNVGFPFAILRWIAGTFIVLIVPGYALAWSLFPSRSEYSGLDRLALTIVLSLFLVPSVALLLNYTPVGIREEPLALILSALTVTFLLVGARREYLNVRRKKRQ